MRRQRDGQVEALDDGAERLLGVALEPPVLRWGRQGRISADVMITFSGNLDDRVPSLHAVNTPQRPNPSLSTRLIHP